ncbi:hypothetical protein B0H16DRAFT_1486765 [Mycena metata]|uniref:Uncharacterized protein n=1 Tax=Mycena metata TaxID=1033252 RepID=A0AAD7DHH2_9AGAR|nr:hypothetical protein B0H16DRAFT_1486765 [Mycena metata]
MLTTNLQPYTAVSKPRTLKPSPHAMFPYDLAWALSYLAWKNVQLDKAPLCLVFEENFAEGADAGVFGDGTTPGHFLREVDLSGFGNGEFEMTTSSSNNSFLQNGYLYIVPMLTNGGVGNDYNATDCTFNLVAPNGGFTAGPNGDERGGRYLWGLFGARRFLITWGILCGGRGRTGCGYDADKYGESANVLVLMHVAVSGLLHVLFDLCVGFGSPDEREALDFLPVPGPFTAVLIRVNGGLSGDLCVRHGGYCRPKHAHTRPGSFVLASWCSCSCSSLSVRPLATTRIMRKVWDGQAARTRAHWYPFCFDDRIHDPSIHFYPNKITANCQLTPFPPFLVLRFDYAGYFAACSRTTNSTAGTIINPVQSARLSMIPSAKGFWVGRQREDGDNGEDDAVPADYGAGGGERIVHGVEVDAICLVGLCGRVMAECGELKELRALQRLGRCCTLRISQCGSGPSTLSTMRVFALLRSTGSSGSRVCVLEQGDLVSSSSLVSTMVLSCRIVRATSKGDRRVSMLARPGIFLVGGRSRKRLEDEGDGVARGMICGCMSVAGMWTRRQQKILARTDIRSARWSSPSIWDSRKAAERQDDEVAVDALSCGRHRSGFLGQDTASMTLMCLGSRKDLLADGVVGRFFESQC